MTTKVKSLPRILESALKNIDLSIIAYLESVIDEALSGMYFIKSQKHTLKQQYTENKILTSDDLYLHLHEPFNTYQIVSSDLESHQKCSKIFQLLVINKYCKEPKVVRQQILQSLKKGMTVMAKFTDDKQWYGAVIQSITDTEVQVTYADYGNSEWLDPLSIDIIDKKLSTLKIDDVSNNNPISSPTTDEIKVDDTNRSLKKGIKISDCMITNDDVSLFINSQMYHTSRFLTDTVRGQQELSDFGLTSRQKKKLKIENEKKEKILRFDPLRYLKSIRQKARPEWFNPAMRLVGDRNILIRKYTMSTLDDKYTLLEDVDIKLMYGGNYGFIGLNGSGKTTLLRRMSRYDIEEFPPHLRILHVEQEILGDDTLVLDYVLSCDVVRSELLDKVKKLNDEKVILDERYQQMKNIGNESESEKKSSDVNIPETEKKFPDVNIPESEKKSTDVNIPEMKNSESDSLETKLEPISIEDYNKESDKITNEINSIYELMSALDCLNVESRAKEVLSGLGFTNAMMQWPTNRLSGGWRMRVSLAGALFVQPDILLLDEPTNHLDFPSVIWLENYLTTYAGTLLVVSHDREFLNNVVQTIIHLHNKQLFYYKGNFSTFLEVRQHRYQQQLKEYDNQQNNISHITSFIDKFRYNAKKASMVQSRIKTLQNMKRILKPEKPYEMNFDFPNCLKIPGTVVSLRNVTFGYSSDNILLNSISCYLDQQSRIGVIGANGSGKTTLINLMLGKLQPLYGEIITSRQCSIAIFTQHHMNQLDLSLTAMDYLLQVFKEDCMKQARPAEYVRGKLGKFGIVGDLVNQRMVFLSGGQKSRVAFTSLTWKIPNFIIMDEPTNHLDVETIQGLIGAINRWMGGLLIVSHDQHFLNSVSKEFWALSKKSGTIETFQNLSDAKVFAIQEA